MKCVAVNRGRPNTRNYGAIKAEESGVETETGRKRECNESATMKAGNVFDGHWVRIARVSFLVISFTSENNCLARIFPLFLFFFHFSFVRSRSLFDSISILLSLPRSFPLSLCTAQLQIICNFVCPRAFVLRLAFKKKILFKLVGAAPRHWSARRVSRLTRAIRVSILHLPRTDKFLTWGLTSAC